MRKMRDLLVALEQLRARGAHVLARFVEPEGGVPYLLLQQIEACSHLPQLVAGVSLHGHNVDGGVRGLQIAALSISTPADRMKPSWGALVKEAAERISRAVGHRPGARIGAH